MVKTLYEKYYNINPELLDTSKWKITSTSEYSDKELEIYLNRKKAIDLYISRTVTNKEIFEKTGINRKELNRFFERCLSLGENNEMYGYNSLIPNKNLKSYKRQIDSNGVGVNASSLPGAFTKLLEDYPELENKIIERLLRKDKNNLEPVTKVKYLHRHFVNDCISLGIKNNEDYPLNTKDKGKQALYRYKRNFEKKNPSKIMKDLGKDASTQFHSTGIKTKQEVITRPFQRVEFDGHLIDVIVSMRVESPDGISVVRNLGRIWLLIVVDVATRVILGYHITLNQQYDRLDVLATFKNAIIPWKRRNFVVLGLNYPNRGGFPSSVIPETEFAIWDEISMDNAKPHYANIVKDKLLEDMGCRINFGPAGTPTGRPYVEKVFDLLEESLHRTVVTTGSGPKDPIRKSPESKSIKYEVTYEEICDLAEVIIYEYNGTPLSSMYYLTPLQLMKQRLESGLLPRKFDENIDLLSITVTRTVAGNMKSGKRPYIQYEGARYRSDVLGGDYSLLKTELNLIIDTEDVSKIRAFRKDGSEVGLLYAQPPWSTPHSLRTRKLLNKKENSGEISFLNEEDYISAFHDHLVEKAPTSKRARNNLVYLKNTSFKEDESHPSQNVEILVQPSDGKKSYLSKETKQLIKKRITFNN
ncbi:MAG: hypothetical protein K0R18_844 [Bacillales bacterium]|jgi:transposase InsO family protein|nr:hypothetical protein [Bacillales bacterium]